MRYNRAFSYTPPRPTCRPKASALSASAASFCLAPACALRSVLFPVLFAALFSVLCLVQLALPGVPKAAVDLQTHFSFAQTADGQNVAALRLKIPAGHHAYANDPGDVGKPAQLSFLVQGEENLAPVYYPKGAQQRDFYDKDANINVYEGEEWLFAALPGDVAAKRYTASLSLLLCSSVNCTPVDVDLNGTIPAEIALVQTMPWREHWSKLSLEVAPVQAKGTLSLSMETTSPLVSQGIGVDSGSGGGLVRLQDPLAADAGADPLAKDPLANDPLAQDAPAGDAAQVLPAPQGFDFTIKPVFADTSVEIYGLGKALLLGILAGLLLNAMPCVLPVITFKMTTLLLAGGRDKHSLARFREHNLFFAAGVLTLFTILALVLGALDLMWGQLYQSQEFLLVMLMLVFLLGLSMLGVFNLPVFDFKSRSANPRIQAYLTGLLSTFLATPCSGPLLGGVLGWAFTQSLIVLVVVFWAVGLGMALPYVVLSIWPGLARILPRPGAWMQTFEHILGFLLLGTALYLLSILPDEKHIPILFALLGTALAAFLWRQFCGLDAPKARRQIGSAVFVTVLIMATFFAITMERTPTTWAHFNAREFSTLLGSKPMVVEFTADWCPNCKFVEATVFTDERLKDMRSAYDVEFIRVDLTDANAQGTKLLEMLGSRSIPLTALFPAGENAFQPTVLRDVFTGASFDKAARETFLQ